MACGCCRCRCRCRHIKHFPAICCPPQRRCQLVAIRSQLFPCQSPHSGSYSYYRNRICQIEVEMLSAFPCHLASVYRLIVCLPVCLFVRLPIPPLPHPFSHCPFWPLHSLLVSVLDSVSVSDSVLVSVSLSGLGLGLGLLGPSPFAVYLIVCLFGGPTLINCRFYWHFGFDVVVY